MNTLRCQHQVVATRRKYSKHRGQVATAGWLPVELLSLSIEGEVLSMNALIVIPIGTKVPF